MTTIAVAPPRRTRLGPRRRWSFAFLAPSVGLLGLFVLLPVALTIWLSFQDWSTQTPFGASTGAGLANFRSLFGDGLGRPRLQAGACQHGALHGGLGRADPAAVGRVRPAGLPASRSGGTGVLRTILFSTYMVPMIAVALVWSKLYSPTEGPINQMLGWVGIPPQPWLSSPDTALRSIVLLNVWQQVGYFTVLAVAGLTQIPDTVYEAAAIDGASGPRLLWRDHAAAAAAHAAVHRRHRPHQRGAGVRAGGADHAGRPGRLDQHAHLPHPPGRHRAHAGRARIGDGGDADAGADGGDRGAVRPPATGRRA